MRLKYLFKMTQAISSENLIILKNGHSPKRYEEKRSDLPIETI